MGRDRFGDNRCNVYDVVLFFFNLGVERFFVWVLGVNSVGNIGVDKEGIVRVDMYDFLEVLEVRLLVKLKIVYCWRIKFIVIEFFNFWF